MSVFCQYCRMPAELVNASVVYGRPGFGRLWYCEACQAWVGVHKTGGHDRPMGTLANAELRGLRNRAHRAFDPLWEAAMRKKGYKKNEARRRAYKWLAGKMGIENIDDCHIGLFGSSQCLAVIEICSSIRITKS